MNSNTLRDLQLQRDDIQARAKEEIEDAMHRLYRAGAGIAGIALALQVDTDADSPMTATSRQRVFLGLQSLGEYIERIAEDIDNARGGLNR